MPDVGVTKMTQSAGRTYNLRLRATKKSSGEKDLLGIFESTNDFESFYRTGSDRSFLVCFGRRVERP